MGVKLLTCGTISSILCVVIGIVGMFITDKIVHNMVTSTVKLVPGSDIFNQWMDPPIEVYINFNLFTIINGDEFQKNGTKPIFKEVGPIVYREYVVKENVTNNLNGTISYNERKYYVFSPEKSAVTEDDTIITLNMAAITIINQVKYQSGFVHSAINLALQGIGETLLVKKTIREIMFGYEDQFLKILKTLLPNLVPTDIVGLFTGKNNTVDGFYTISTGEDDYKNIGIVRSYNGEDILNIWTTKYANMINGTDGTLIAPFVNETQKIFIFVNDLCRSLYTVYSDTIHTYHDIKLLGFSPEEKFFYNASSNPDNAGFCTPAGNCLPSGVLNLTLCLQGVPIIQSSPHFLFCDERYVNDVVGIKPNYEKHRTQLYVEPTTGVLMKANKRIQFNTQLYRDPRITITKNLPEILYPLMWVDENFVIDKPSADKFFYQVKLPLMTLDIGRYVLIGIGLVGLLVSVIFITKFKHKSGYIEIKQRENVNVNNSEVTQLIE